MPKSSNTIMNLKGETQGLYMAKCDFSELKTFNNKRAIDMWERIHNKTCNCFKGKKQKITDYTHHITDEEAKKCGRMGNVSKNQQLFLNK